MDTAPSNPDEAQMNESITTLVFDGGNTLIADDSRFTGSMADWPEITATEGVHQALEKLAKQYRLVIATNAADSTMQKIQEANRQVGLNGYFDRIFTARDLPALNYFKAIEADLETTPSEMVMVGDSYQNDILGACNAGWRAVWYNPRHLACASLTPLHSAEINHMSHLPSALANMELPTVPQCLLWLRQHDASFNLIQHVQAVAASAYQTALWLRAAGHDIDPVLAHRGGLLHDLGKIKSLRNQSAGLNHGEYAAKLLTEWGFTQLAEIARRHLLFSIANPDTAPITLEQKLVYFCDKIVEGAQIVPLEKRMNKLQQRYAHDKEKIQACLPALQKMQQDLCSAMHMPPHDLIPRLAKTFLEN